MQAALHPALSIIRRRRRLLLFVCSSLAIMTPFAKPMSNKSRKRPHQQMGDDWAGLGVALSGRVAGGGMAKPQTQPFCLHCLMRKVCGKHWQWMLPDKSSCLWVTSTATDTEKEASLLLHHPHTQSPWSIVIHSSNELPGNTKKYWACACAWAWAWVNPFLVFLSNYFCLFFCVGQRRKAIAKQAGTKDPALMNWIYRTTDKSSGCGCPRMRGVQFFRRV